MSAVVEEAFRKLLMRSKESDCGKWIPITYWVEKVLHLLDDTDDLNHYLLQKKPNKLLSKLKNILDIDISVGIVLKIVSNKRSIATSSEGKKRDVAFLCLESVKKKQPKPDNDKETTKMYQQAYIHWINHRKSHSMRKHRQLEKESLVEEPTATANNLTVDTRRTSDEA